MLNADSATLRASGNPASAKACRRPGRTGLVAERLPALRDRVRHAQVVTGGVPDQPQRVQVVLEPVARVGLDREEPPVLGQVLAGVRERPDRVTEVVQGVEHADEVVGAVVALCLGDLERTAVGDAAAAGCHARPGAPTPRGGRCRRTSRPGRTRAISIIAVPRPQPTSSTRMPASSRSTSPGTAASHSGTSWLRNAGRKKRSKPDEQPRVVLVPAEALAAGVAVRQLVDGRPHRREHLEPGRHERGPVLVCQHQRVLGRNGERRGWPGRRSRSRRPPARRATPARSARYSRSRCASSTLVLPGCAARPR